MTRVTGWCGAVLAAAAAGCGSAQVGPGFGSPDGRKVAELVAQLDDDKSTAANVRKLFAAGVVPPAADLRRMSAYSYDVKGDPVVSGDSATATIAMRSERKDGADAGEKEWTFVKEGDGWKIKSAPLP